MKFKRILFISMLTLTTLILYSCNSKEEDSIKERYMPHGVIEINESKIIAGPSGGEYTIKINSSEDWKVAGVCEWVEFDKVSGKSGEDLTFRVVPNTTQELRKVEFRVFAGSATETISVVSNPEFKIELFGESNIDVPADGMKFNVMIKTNVDELQYDIDQNWVEFTGKTEGFGKTYLNFQVAKSQMYKDRHASVHISGEGVSQYAELQITQAQRDTAFVVHEGGDVPTGEVYEIVKDLASYKMELKLKANVEISLNTLPNWLTCEISEPSEPDEQGLSEIIMNLSCEEAKATRAADINIMSDGEVVGRVMFKQQNPNPIMVTIEDEGFRTWLSANGWIYDDEKSEQVELLERALTETRMRISQGAYDTPIKKLSGLSVFPELKVVMLESCPNLQKVDLTDTENIVSLDISNRLSRLETVNLGDNDVKSLSFAGSSRGHNAPNLLVVGSKLEQLDVSLNGDWYSYYYDNVVQLDITGCPALKTLLADRHSASGRPTNRFRFILVSQDQMRKINSNQLRVEKGVNVQIRVKN